MVAGQHPDKGGSRRAGWRTPKFWAVGTTPLVFINKYHTLSFGEKKSEKRKSAV